MVSTRRLALALEQDRHLATGCQDLASALGFASDRGAKHRIIRGTNTRVASERTGTCQPIVVESSVDVPDGECRGAMSAG
jgi:hypothetical protein